jgi:hypothetical protein
LAGVAGVGDWLAQAARKETAINETYVKRMDILLGMSNTNKAFSMRDVKKVLP